MEQTITIGLDIAKYVFRAMEQMPPAGMARSSHPPSGSGPCVVLRA
jgi:hypothetical protein